ncbi:MAG: molybdate ABC transporter substrate-binding protein [Synergistaceae bacterium]|nr:molybdate ABC transporter substrate-binding protein [Synergistaceae bacterium]
MKKFFLVLFLVLCVLVNTAGAEKKDLIVFAAASMTETMNEIKNLYENENPDVNVIFNFDSSGTLKTQIQEGAACDLFISAGQKQMNQLEELKLILNGTRINLLENKIALVVPDGYAGNIKSFDDLAKALKNEKILFAMGNSDVPVGQYTQKIFAYYGLDEKELAQAGKITYGSNVKEVTTQVKESSVDCGVVYCTDAYSAGLKIIDTATPEMCGQVIYPAAVIKESANINSAEKFLDYLTKSEAMKIFASVGFSPAKN